MQAHIFISGFVQGVGFRRFVRHHALKLGLTGWVKNLLASPAGGTDNRVEAILQGGIENINKMIEICKKGAFLSEVKDVQINFKDAKTAYGTFEIIK